MGTANLTREETAERSRSIELERVRVEVDLRRAADPDVTGFPSRTTLEFRAETGETWLDFIGESVDRVVVNGEDQEVRYAGARILIRELRERNTVTIEATAAYSRSGEGLHRFVDPADGETYLYTQYEPADARRVMACFEQPDMRASYTFVVRAPAGWRILSNTAPESETSEGSERTVEFAPTLPLPSYLTALAAGPYHRAESAAGEVALAVYCRASLAPHLESEEIFEVTRQGLAFYEHAFGIAYPWGKYDHLFAPEYNLGAMENPGLVTFSESFVFRGASTAAERERRAEVILHEMAHMWFGDLVTMRWWDDLWLKESFADYMGSHAAVRATGFDEAWVSFANRRKAWAYTQDQLSTTHPIVADIPDLEAAKLNFDGITYAKGAAVLKQLVAFVGEDVFFAAARRYFAAHAYGSATRDDFLAALEEASGRDMRAWSQAWLETSGLSTLELEDRRILVQTDPRPHRLAIGCYRFENDRLEPAGRIELDIVEARTPVELPDADLVLVNDGDPTYGKVRLDAASLDAAERGLSTIADPLARGLVWAALWNAVRDGLVPVARYLRIVRDHAPCEESSALLQTVLANASFAIGRFLPDPGSARERWLAITRRGLSSATPASDHQLVWARAFAAAAHFSAAADEQLRAMLAGDPPAGLPLDPSLRWELLSALVTRGLAGVEEIGAEHDRDRTASGAVATRRLLASRPDAEVRREAWDTAWNDASLSKEQLAALIAGVRAGDRRELTERFDPEYFERILPAWERRTIEISQQLVTGLFPPADTVVRAQEWLDSHPEAPAALVRLVREEIDQLSRALRVRAAQPKEVLADAEGRLGA